MNPDNFARTLIQIITAPSVSEMARVSCQVFIDLVQPQALCLLLWDNELDHYLVGYTWLHPTFGVGGPDFRREALQRAQNAYEADRYEGYSLDGGLYYQPLANTGVHVGALIMARIALVDNLVGEPYAMLMQVVSSALDNALYRQQTERERLQSEAERERLEHLLQAVNQQQRTIDELLAVERQLSTTLEAKVQERTAALQETQSRLIQSEKLAVIGQLASSLAHELNTPLQAIQSGLGLVRHYIETGNLVRTRRDLSIIQQEVERMAAFIRQMLDFYRPVTYSDAPLDLNAVCKTAGVLMRKRLQELRFSLEMDLSDNLPLTYGDSNQLIQVLLNLMLNATEAITGDSGLIVLRTCYDAQHVYLSVIDRGAGISPENLERIFEPLFTTKARGLGLGLAISREIIERHTGKITVESDLSIGTSFTIRLPIKECYHG